MKRLMLDAVVAAALLGCSMTASASFVGYYAPAQWTISHVPNASADTGSVDSSGAPGSITLTGSDNLTPNDPDVISRLDFTIIAPSAGTFSFHWEYLTSDSFGDPLYDPAGYILGATILQLAVPGGPAAQSGDVSIPVSQGDVIGFHVGTLDNKFGAATLTISNFSGPTGQVQVPEPSSTALLALGLAGIAGMAAARRRRLR